MCTVVLERNRTNDKFLVVNTILAKTEEFSVNDVVDELKNKGVDVTNVIENCIDDLINNGLIYEIGNRYKVRDRQRRWSMM